ncbi:MAG: multicopper oxidase domain-containing protein [Nitrospirae bacterium]|nr:multicopper oxidase domain-containing protein [Nitrospirota bacterium]
MKKLIDRREFLKFAGGVTAMIVVGCGGGGGDNAPGGGGPGGGGSGPGPGAGGVGTETLNFHITDAIKEMITHEPNNPNAGASECYFWVFKEDRFPADCPGPQIFAVTGDIITVNVTNDLDTPHAFFIPGMVDTGPIAPGATVTKEFTAGAPGVYLYHDNLNEPVNRVMGLHGAFVIMPAQLSTPYGNPTQSVQALFNDFGTTPWWPGLSWAAGDPANNTPAARQHIWLIHEASPVLFEEVGLAARSGTVFNATTFVNAFTNDPFLNTSNDPRTVATAQFPKSNVTVGGITRGVFNRKPHFFTMNGQSGFFSHHNPAITPMYRVGEPCVIRILNAGLNTHSLHLHANHFFVTAINNVPQENPIWVDVFTIMPMDHVDYTIPYMRPPDVPNVRGIGRADTPSQTQSGGRTWPPVEELARQMPAPPAATFPMLQSPLCFPMHDHSEPSQTAKGANYNNGMISGMYFFGDRNTPGAMNFTLDAEFRMLSGFGPHSGETGPAVGGWPPENAGP